MESVLDQRNGPESKMIPESLMLLIDRCYVHESLRRGEGFRLQASLLELLRMSTSNTDFGDVFCVQFRYWMWEALPDSKI